MNTQVSRVKTNHIKSVIHKGYDILPSTAFEMLQSESINAYLIDVRTKPEFIYVGHPISAINIPYKFWTGNFVNGVYELALNLNFSKELHKRFDSKNDKLIFICRSGIKSCNSVNCTIESGWKPENTFNLLGGFEGDLVIDINNKFYGKRKIGGWKNNNLPWTYEIVKENVNS